MACLDKILIVCCVYGFNGISFSDESDLDDDDDYLDQPRSSLYNHTGRHSSRSPRSLSSSSTQDSSHSPRPIQINGACKCVNIDYHLSLVEQFVSSWMLYIMITMGSSCNNVALPYFTISQKYQNLKRLSQLHGLKW